jgi:hypothetical protein
MSSFKSNERELAGKVAQWFNEQIGRGNYPFKSASNEPGIEVDDRTYFGDIVLWESDESRVAYSLIELKPPFGAAENLERFRQKALELNIYPSTGKLQTSEDFMGQYTLKDTDGQEIFTTDEQHIEKFSILLAKPNQYTLNIPKDIAIVRDILQNYHSYITDLKHRLEVNAQQKLHSWSEAEKMVGEILQTCQPQN